MSINEARDALREFCRRNGGQVAMGKLLSVSQSTVSSWVVEGHGRPDAVARRALWLVASIPEDAWLTDGERARLEAISARGNE